MRSVAAIVLVTAIGPILWGSTYIVFTQSLPVDHPLLVGALRALPAGILLLLLGAGSLPRDRLARVAVLGFANIGLFFGLLFVGAALLPGGVAATVAAVQPLVVGLLAWPLLGRRPHPVQGIAAVAGMVGVGLLVLDPSARLDPVGILAALGGAASMAVGTVLIEKWGRLASPLALTAWQLTLGGLILLPIALLVEGLPPPPTPVNAAGLAYLVICGTALAYWLWNRGITLVGADVVFLTLLSPLVATLLGAAILGEWLTAAQLGGIALILGATAVGMMASRRGVRPAPLLADDEKLPRPVETLDP